MRCKKFSGQGFGRKTINAGKVTVQKGCSLVYSGYPQPGAQ
ncbi:hypothetical protein C4K39_0718 [Pseudomonas sessilinigenes]|nr:hypothetical protein C4K39_0718 [Pseudomonas sessilinigenes]